MALGSQSWGFGNYIEKRRMGCGWWLGKTTGMGGGSLDGRDGWEIVEDGGVAGEEDGVEGGGAADGGSWRRTWTGAEGGTGGEDGGTAVWRRRRPVAAAAA